MDKIIGCGNSDEHGDVCGDSDYRSGELAVNLCDSCTIASLKANLAAERVEVKRLKAHIKELSVGYCGHHGYQHLGGDHSDSCPQCEVERLTAIIRELLISMPGRAATCDDMHHAKKDQHGCDEECKPLARFEKAVAMAAKVISPAIPTKEPK